MASAQYFGKEFPTDAPDAVQCKPCQQWFIPDDNCINVVRIHFDQPGVIVCPQCMERFQRMGIVERDETKLKCKCRTLDKDDQGKPCPVHSNPAYVSPTVN